MGRFTMNGRRSNQNLIGVNSNSKDKETSHISTIFNPTSLIPMRKLQPDRKIQKSPKSTTRTLRPSYSVTSLDQGIGETLIGSSKLSSRSSYEISPNSYILATTDGEFSHDRGKVQFLKVHQEKKSYEKGSLESISTPEWI